MQFMSKTAQQSKLRLLISGLSNTGKTTSLPTFIYGPYDYWSDTPQCEEEQQAAIDYADGKHMVIISLPGETGSRSLMTDTPHLTSYSIESSPGDDTNSAEWSRDALSAYDKLYSDVECNKPDILCNDGATSLCDHIFNSITNGEWLAGTDLSTNPNTGVATDKYRAAKFYNYGHRTFGSYIAKWYMSPIPLIVVTCLESWQAARLDSDRPGAIGDTRYLWPDMPGEMATRIVGKFDARLSATFAPRCLHKQCADSASSISHHVWQFLPRGDVMGVGIKGLKVKEVMKQKPYIHQCYSNLKELMENFT